MSALEAPGADSWQDGALLRQWESLWEQIWQRPAAVFARADHLLTALATALDWQPGDWILADGLLEPCWRQACRALWLRLWLVDVDPVTGLSPADAASWPDHPPRAWLRCHSFGQVADQPRTPSVAVSIEICSAVPIPVEGCGLADFQIVGCDGNQAIAAGSACVLLGRDTALMQTIRRLRHTLPATLSCAIGLSRLQQWPMLAQRRNKLAQCYLQTLRPKGWFHLPASWPKTWFRFIVNLSCPEDRQSLQQWLLRAGIGAGSPVWYAIPEQHRLPGLQQFCQCSLAIPLFASLDERQQKRIINRIHRWTKRSVGVQ
ncbi:MAG: DegT/DnrJ/EryC1/StrS family aminotransferase [Magnetococcales bacterium]|nr:DegT/DnrJ/EryC1/StrS family aminotransferase [Magnetococcales bacterium]